MRTKKNNTASKIKPGKTIPPNHAISDALSDSSAAVTVRNELDAAACGITARHLKKAALAEQIIRKDFATWHLVPGLAAMVSLTELELQRAFRLAYGQTVACYTRQARLQYAHDLLEQTDAPLRVICEMIGYPDPSNFSTAFFKQFGYRPGRVRTSPGLLVKGREEKENDNFT